MFGLDAYLDLAKIWGDMALTCMTAASEASATMLAPLAGGTTVFSPPCGTAGLPSSSTRVQGWSGGPAESRSASWYREPSRSPFEPLFGLAWTVPLTAPAVLPAPQQVVPGFLQPLQAWMSLLDTLTPRVGAAPPISWAGWPHSSDWAMATLPWMAGLGFAMAAPAPGRPAASDGAQFATYRSDSGHAVAQITFPNDVVAAVAVPPGAASLLDAFFPWMKAYC